MKKSSILILSTLNIFLLTACGEETKENHTNTIETPKKTYLDTPTNTYKKRVETLNIANTIQTPVTPPVVGRGFTKKLLKENDKRIKEQEKAMKALTK